MKRKVVVSLGAFLGVFMISMFVYRYGQRQINSCRVRSFLGTDEVNCGYVKSTEDGSVDYYAGKFQEIKREKGKYYLFLDTGRKTPLKFLISHDSLNLTRLIEKRTPDVVKSDDLLRLGLEGKGVTVGVPAGSQFLKFIEAQQPQLPTDIYPSLHNEAKRIADCDRPISYLRSHNFLPLFYFCEIETNDIYIL